MGLLLYHTEPQVSRLLLNSITVFFASCRLSLKPNVPKYSFTARIAVGWQLAVAQQKLYQGILHLLIRNAFTLCTAELNGKCYNLKTQWLKCFGTPKSCPPENIVESKDTHSLWLKVIIAVGDQVSWVNPKNFKGFCFMPPSFIRLYIVRTNSDYIVKWKIL